MNKTRKNIEIGDLVKLKPHAALKCFYFYVSSPSAERLRDFPYYYNDNPIFYVRKSILPEKGMINHFFLYEENIIFTSTYSGLEDIDNWFEKVESIKECNA